MMATSATMIKSQVIFPRLANKGIQQLRSLTTTVSSSSSFKFLSANTNNSRHYFGGSSSTNCMSNANNTNHPYHCHGYYYNIGIRRRWSSSLSRYYSSSLSSLLSSKEFERIRIVGQQQSKIKPIIPIRRNSYTLFSLQRLFINNCNHQSPSFSFIPDGETKNYQSLNQIRCYSSNNNNNNNNNNNTSNQPWGGSSVMSSAMMRYSYPINNATAITLSETVRRQVSSSTKTQYNLMTTTTTTATTPQQTIRFLTTRNSSSGSGNGSGNNKKSNEKEQSIPKEKELDPQKLLSSSTTTTTTTATNSNHKNKIQEFMDSTVSTVRPMVGSAEATIKRAVVELTTPDLLSVYGIIFLMGLIAVAPSMIRHMRQSDSTYDDIDPEDPVMDLARMLRDGKLNWRGGNDDEMKESGSSSSSMGLDRIVADLLKSPQIQEAANNLVTKVIQSSQFKTACQVLLKELLQDLLDDPDTLKQVVHLLQHAIVDEKIKEAAVQLATDIFGDDRVLDELVTLVQRLGLEQQVQQATQALLVESAHNALNDPEILDHSMEFATDVVGDDVVQQTAGEALYNTMSYAFRPTLSVILTLLGVGLIFVSIAAFRNVNQTPNDANDRAFFDTIETYTSRLLKLLFLPLDFVAACKDAIVGIFLFPFRILSSSLSWAGKLGESMVASIQKWFIWLLYLPTRFLTSIQEGSRTILWSTSAYIISQLSRVKDVASTSFMGVFFRKAIEQVSGVSNKTKIQWIILNHRLSDYILFVERFGKQTIEAIQTATNDLFGKLVRVQDDATKLTALVQRERKAHVDKLSKGYNSLNQILEDFAFSIEDVLRRFSRIF